MSLLDVGITSLFASKYALSVANQNIANAQNPFYTRRVVDFKEANFGSSGNGVQLMDVRRVFDEVTNRNLIRTTSDAASAESYYKQFKGFESLLDDKATNVASYIKHSFTQLNSLNIDPASTQSRTLYLSQLNHVANRLNQVSQDIQNEQMNVSNSIISDVSQVNILSKQIAHINAQIALSEGPGAPENMPLMDDRDRLLNKMAEYINFNSNIDKDGIINIQLGSGVPLVTGNKFSTMITTPSAKDPSTVDVAIDTNVGPSEVITSLISGGKLFAAMSFQQNGLKETQMGLDRLALAMAFKINEQHQLGVDLKGRLGGNVLSDMNAPTLSGQRVIAETANAGTSTLSVDIKDVTQLALSDYQLTLSTGTQYQLVRLSDNQIVGTGNITSVPFNVDADGFSINVTSANFVAGDTFTISPMRNAARFIQVAITDPSRLAIGLPVVASSSEKNIGKGVIALDKVTDTSTSAFSIPGQLNPPVAIEFIDPTSYRVISIADGHVIADNQTYDASLGASIFPTSGGYDPGYRASLSGDMQKGDRFEMNYNQSGSVDNRNGLLLADLYQQGVLEDGTLSFLQGYNSISDDVSSKTNIAKLNDTAQGIIKNQAELRRDALSGVSLEEEAMNIARYQESYQASAQILDTVRTMFDVVLNLLRR